MSFAPLTTQEIEFRVQSISSKGYAIILPYKDARADMKKLDEAFGIEGWQKKYELINGNLFCSVGIWSDKNNQWIWKQDVGTASNTEAEKGEASDAFKRACFNIGIGRELYDYPLIMIKLNPDEFEAMGNKGKQTYKLRLKSWKWESQFVGSTLVYLKATDEKGNKRFSFGAEQKENLPKISTNNLASLHIVMGEYAKAKGGDVEKIKESIYKKYSITTTKDLNITQYEELINHFKILLYEHIYYDRTLDSRSYNQNN